MPYRSSRDTLLVQLFAIGDSVSKLRTELVELGGALIEAEHKRLAGKLQAIEAEHAQLVDAVYTPPVEH
jgi:hypothetical protein